MRRCQFLGTPLAASFPPPAAAASGTPLGMTSTALAAPPSWEPRMARPHNRRGEVRTGYLTASNALHAFAAANGKPVSALRYNDSRAAAAKNGDPPLPNWILPHGAASMVTTADDYARFLLAVLDRPRVNGPAAPMRSGKDWQLAWGLGWGIEQARGREFGWQWGDNGGFKNFVLVEWAQCRAWFVFTNGDGGAKIYERLLERLTGLEHPAFLAL